MSTDLRSDLERARRLAPRHDVDFESLHRRHDRRARVRKAGTLTLALLIGAGVIGGAFLVRQGPAGVSAAGGAGVDLPTPPGLAMPAGDYLFRHIETYPSAGQAPTTTMVWWSGDGSGRVRSTAADDTTFGPGRCPPTPDPSTTCPRTPPCSGDQMIQRMAPDGASPEPADQFTPGPGQPDHVTAGMIRSIGELLDDPNTTPDLRAALFRVAAGLDGVTLTRDTVDPVGRAATELTVTTTEHPCTGGGSTPRPSSCSPARTTRPPVLSTSSWPRASRVPRQPPAPTTPRTGSSTAVHSCPLPSTRPSGSAG